MKISKTGDILLNIVLPIAAGIPIYLFPVNNLIRNYLPDALWAYAFMSCMLITWDRQLKLTWAFVTYSIFIAFEVLQYMNYIKGTGDVIDVLIYCSSATIALIINQYNKKNEKIT